MPSWFLRLGNNLFFGLHVLQSLHVVKHYFSFLLTCMFFFFPTHLWLFAWNLNVSILGSCLTQQFVVKNYDKEQQYANEYRKHIMIYVVWPKVYIHRGRRWRTYTTIQGVYNLKTFKILMSQLRPKRTLFLNQNIFPYFSHYIRIFYIRTNCLTVK